MSKARPVYKDTDLMLTRRIRGRVFLLTPSKRLNNLIRYVVAVFASNWDIDVYAMTAMSNHWHVCLGDRHGNIVKFQRDCHSFIARGLNASKGEFESIWDDRQGSRVECEEPNDLMGRIAYTMANPVEAGLVRYGSSWPGVRHCWPRKPIVAAKPTKFFRSVEQGGEWPMTAELTFARPPGYDGLSNDELAAIIKLAVETREAKFRLEHDAKKLPFLGREKVLAQSRYASPSTKETRFGISPRIACHDKWKRIERLELRQQWEPIYSQIRDKWIAGESDVLFPYGTYKLRVEQGVPCMPAPT